jgi:hypothetical protein
VTSTGVNVWVPVPLEVKSTAVPAKAFGRLVASLNVFAFKAITKYVEPLVSPPTAALPAAYLTFGTRVHICCRRKSLNRQRADRHRSRDRESDIVDCVNGVLRIVKQDP